MLKPVTAECVPLRDAVGRLQTHRSGVTLLRNVLVAVVMLDWLADVTRPSVPKTAPMTGTRNVVPRTRRPAVMPDVVHFTRRPLPRV
jgi:hypothetical protein